MESPNFEATNPKSENGAPPRLLLALPDGIDAGAVAARKTLILAASAPGMHPLIAERFALEAEQQQQWHDDPASRTFGQHDARKSEAEKLAAEILAAQATCPSQLVVDPVLAAPSADVSQLTSPNDVESSLDAVAS